ncbi:DUF2530 domain-containing protein [Corynebacterium sp. TAE3-ERU12]|uniref:DUF2530 domain-containing protein n=1 Tax=Corynebacterium sp. TAE3-ERU12 TaxID=2849491 RepID=UPI001C43B48D|nr:DUF2530 domain-containing protein [Corynebacterium sp. TAE3-ERU12]
MNRTGQTFSQLPRWLADPRPALAVGIAAFSLAAVVVTITHGAGSHLAHTCWVGVILGVLGWGVYLWQRISVSRGAKWVQDGLEDTSR